MAHRRHRTPLPASRRRLVAALERWTLFQLDRAAAALREVTEEALEPHGLSVAAFADHA